MITPQAVTLFSTVQGNGEPVLLLHGLFGMGSNLGMVAKVLSEDFQVHSLDLRNHGQSPHAENMNLALLSADVAQYISDNQLAPCHIIGHSLGGKVAMQLALDHPGLVKKMIIADIAPVDYEDQHSEIIQALLTLDVASLSNRRQADQQLAALLNEPPRVRQFLLMNLQKTDHGYQWLMNLPAIKANYHNLRDDISQPVTPNPLPVLFIKGELSNYILPEHHTAIISRFPNASFKVIQGTNHWLHVEKPAVFNRLCLDFLNQ